MDRLDSVMMDLVLRRVEENPALSKLIRVVSEDERLVKAQNDFELGLALGAAFGDDVHYIENIKFKYLGTTQDGKLYELHLRNSEKTDEYVHNVFSEKL